MSKYKIQHLAGNFPVGTPMAGTAVGNVSVSDLRRKVGGPTRQFLNPTFTPGETKIIDESPELEHSLLWGQLKTLKDQAIFSVEEWTNEDLLARLTTNVAELLSTSSTFFPLPSGAGTPVHFSAAANLVGFRSFQEDCATTILANPGVDFNPLWVLDHLQGLEILDMQTRVNQIWTTFATTNLNLEAAQEVCLMTSVGGILKAGHDWAGGVIIPGNNSYDAPVVAQIAARLAMTAELRLAKDAADATGVAMLARAEDMVEALFDETAAAPLVNVCWDTTNLRIKLLQKYNDAAEWAPGALPLVPYLRVLTNAAAVIAASLTSATQATTLKVSQCLTYIETDWTATLQTARWDLMPWVLGAYAAGGDTTKLAALKVQLAADTTRYGTVVSAYDMGAHFTAYYVASVKDTWNGYLGTDALFSAFGHKINIFAWSALNAFLVSGDADWLWFYLGALDAGMDYYVDPSSERLMFEKGGVATNAVLPTHGYGFVPGHAWFAYATAIGRIITEDYLF